MASQDLLQAIKKKKYKTEEDELKNSKKNSKNPERQETRRGLALKMKLIDYFVKIRKEMSYFSLG